jgi:hypothetical protein
MTPPARLEATAPRCIVTPCDTTPPVGALVCVPHARALAALAQKEDDK